MLGLVLLIVAAPVVELACLRTEGSKIDCAKLAEKLQVYAAETRVTVVEAENGVTDDDAIFRVTIHDRPDADLTRVCIVETIALTDKQAPPRTATFVCAEASPERTLALHVKGELDGGFEEALRYLRGGGGTVRRGRLVESPLARSLRPAPEPVEEPAPKPLPEEDEETAASLPASAPISRPAVQVALGAGGGVTGFGQLVAASLRLHVALTFSVPIEVQVGARVGLRPRLQSARGPLAMTLVEPFVSAAYCFRPGRFQLCPGVQAELVYAALRLANFAPTQVITGAAGGRFAASVALHPRVSVGAEAHALVAFHRLEFLSGGVTLLSAPPIVWGSDLFVLLTF